MTRQINRRSSVRATKFAQAGTVSIDQKKASLELFKQGFGFCKVAKEVGLSQNTVREWMRLYRGGNERWVSGSSGAEPITYDKKMTCLELFRQGKGCRTVASAVGLWPTTVKGWLWRFRAGDESWAKRDAAVCSHCAEAKDLIQYHHEIEMCISSSRAIAPCDGSSVGSEQSICGGEDKVAGGAESTAAIPLYSADRACEQILAGGVRKKKEVTAVDQLVAHGSSIIDACRIAGIPRCAYYRARKTSAKAESDAELVRLMCDIENDKHISSTYGVERLTAEVNNRLMKAEPELMSKIMRFGTRVNHKRIHRLMKEHGIHSRIRRRKHPDNYYKSVKEMLKTNCAPNILKRNFTAEMPMRKLSTDVTYIPCSDQKFIFVSPLLDIFNHEVVSFSISTVNSEEFVKRMLYGLPPEIFKGALIHSDQGSVYWANDWVKLCEKLQIVRSMSRKGNCWDNALSENFFSVMKVDLGLTKSGYKRLLPAREVERLVVDYISWYNNGRIQKNLNYMSPVQYKEAFLDKSL
ncbi:MAG: IS3 family transposase [Kiritimatiellae bacterium]|nr:IS3 family transposase [Kiritimatiellia bacterium]